MASLVVQSGSYDISLSTPMVEIRPGSANFTELKRLASLAVDRLNH